jgi:hypothetical protein
MNSPQETVFDSRERTSQTVVGITSSTSGHSDNVLGVLGRKFSLKNDFEKLICGEKFGQNNTWAV